ncbi:MAG: bifunctional diaminohydroxyphosphoribosylaminopyrimidine deaminase/5-amino-6-(5-phosphoribosylamino)uracil reductase RibD [Myxococcales bacterium]|nr:bifunctional diaminohydroxyphosphoribosylaminopyrimidine deaminase/5-amino-6-(5-phosphoribosylamino)uracil reductase RibD [Myxococcales bacterium]
MSPARGTAADAHWIARCLELAGRGGRTSPNPQVGCVIVSPRGRVLAEGWHRGPGTPHAEADALAKVDGRARGATLYVNLEPCRHQGRTPPCAPAVIAAEVARVVIGTLDPIRGHGGGARRIARAGIAVTTGVLAEACRAHNRGFLTWGQHGRPWFTLKAAMTLDGRTATAAAESRWIAGPAARADVPALRASHDAVLIGVGTARADDPRLTVRDAVGTDPIRIVLDSELRLPPTAAMLPAPGRTIVVGGVGAPAIRQRRLRAAGAEVWTLARDRAGRVALPALAAALAAAGVTSVLVEGGGEVYASCLAAGLVDELQLHVAPIALGGRRGGPAWLGGAEVATLAEARRFAVAAVRVTADDDVVLTLRPGPAAAAARRRRK